VRDLNSWRVITLTSPERITGGQNRATVYFFVNPTGLGTVTNVDQPNINGHTASVGCRKEDFAEWYDILRNEAPLKLAYGYSGAEFDPSQPTRQLTWVQLYTGQPEPPGEGPEDVQAHTHPAQVLEVLRAAGER
jgi:hypothetical protein